MIKEETAPSLLLSWPTAGRRQSLLKSIEGFARNFAEYGQDAPLLVAFDDDLRDLSPALAAPLAALSRSLAKPLLIADKAVRLRFLESLPPHIDKESASYALLPESGSPQGSRGPGLNRNFTHLAAAGGFLISTDDDVFYFPAAGSGRELPPVFSTAEYPVMPHYFSDRASLLPAVHDFPQDIISSHLKFLGRTAGEICPETVSEKAASGVICLTSPGTYGDSGFSRARGVLSHEGAGRLRIIEAPYERVRYSREVIRIPERDSVSASLNFMAMQSGYDLRDCLPPFLPYVGNEDGLFALLVRVCRPDSLTAYPSFGLLHDSPGKGSYRRESLTGFKPHISELFMAASLACIPDASIKETRRRMVSLGQNFVDLANANTGDFVEVLHGAWLQGAMNHAAHLEELLEKHDKQPSLWAADVEEHLENIYTLIREPVMLFAETGCGFTVEQCVRNLERYGNLLMIWPDIHDFAVGNPILPLARSI